MPHQKERYGMTRISPQEEYEQAIRRLDDEAKQWKDKRRIKLLEHRDFQEKPLIERLFIYFLKALGFTLSLVLLAALILG